MHSQLLIYNSSKCHQREGQMSESMFRIYPLLLCSPPPLLSISVAATLVSAILSLSWILQLSLNRSLCFYSGQSKGSLRLLNVINHCSAQNFQSLPAHSEKRSKSFHDPQGQPHSSSLSFSFLPTVLELNHTTSYWLVPAYPKLVPPQGLCTGCSICQEPLSPGISMD